MAKFLLISALLLLSTIVDVKSAIVCSGQIGNDEGELNIPVNTTQCDFSTVKETRDLILFTDGLYLSDNDKLTIQSGKNSFTYTPPIDAGYLYIGGQYVEPKLSFLFQNNSTSAMVIRYSRKPSLSVKADINQNFKIVNVGDTSALELKFAKTLNEAIHIELSTPQVPNCILGNYLMVSNENSLLLYPNARNNELIHIKTTIVDKTCSNTFSSLTKPQEISGPPKVSKPYECVNLFNFAQDVKNPSKEAHFDIDFANFISLAADSDELIIRDSRRRLFIDRSSEIGYRGKKMSYNGTELIIIYRAPDISQGNVNLGLKLTVIPENYGGIVLGKKDIMLQANIPTTFTLIPNESKCVSLRPLDQKNLGDASLTLSVDGSAQSILGPNTLLPPTMGTSKSSEQLLVSYSGKKDLKLQFSPDGSCCHELSSDSSGRFSVEGGQSESCYWTVATGEDVTINFDQNELTPDGCVTIQSLASKEPIYSRCNIRSNEIIPSFVVSQAYVNVLLPKKDTRFSASIVRKPAKMSLYENGSITSPGYPVSYPVMSGGQDKYSLNGTKENYLINVADLDLRDGEKLQIGTDEINTANLVKVGDIIVSNTTKDITVTRPTKQTDFSLRRGLKITALTFKEFRNLYVNITANSSATLNNVTSSLTKISNPKSRINYIITPDKLPDGMNIELIDGRSISDPPSYSLTGSTTSDTLLIMARATKTNVTTQSLTIKYWHSPCNITDDLECDNSTRCVPREFQCKGKFYCIDGSDMKQVCNSTGPPPPIPPASNTGVGSFTVFILCTLMLTLGVLLSTYGPGLYKTLEDRFRGSGQYNSFTSVE